MNLKELIKKIFKSETKNYGLALPTDLVSVPMRDCLDDDKIKELDEYKDNYLEILAQKKHFTSHNISSKDFSQEMLMNFELFGRLVINHDNNYNLDTMKDYEKDELWLKQRINPIKIKLYIDKMNAMFNETHLRLVALKEIYSESGKKLSKDKQSAILNEIYNLTSNYIIFKNNVYAALKEVETYKKEINNQGYKVEDEEEDVYLLSQHDFKLSYFASILIPDKLNQIKEMNFYGIDKTAYIERELEIYAYKYLKIDDLNQELDDIDKIEKIPSNRLTLLYRIYELEMKYVVLNDYGGHELDLKPLYEVKFDILTIDIINQKDSPFKEIPDDRQLKYYEDIILDRLTTNITGVDSLLNQRLDDDHKYLINCFTRLLKHGGNYNFTLISADTFSLSLILSAASDEQMNYFFNNYQIDFKNPKIVYRFAKELPGIGIKTEDKVPLSTVCWINNIDILNRKKHNGVILADTNNIVQIYNYFADKENENSLQYKIPDGITRIEILYDGDAARDLILDKADGKMLITPSSLKTLIIPKVPGNLCAHKVVLSEGLESINGPALIDDTTSFLTIPSTLKDAYETVLNYALHSHDAYAWDYDVGMEKLVFTNCEDSITLHDEKQMNDIIKCLYEASMWYLWNKLDLGEVKPPYARINHLPRDIVLVSKDGHQIVVSISSIVNIEFLIMIRSKYAKGFNDTKIKYIYLYFKENFEKKIINEAKEKINEVINNEIKTPNKKK